MQIRRVPPAVLARDLASLPKGAHPQVSRHPSGWWAVSVYRSDHMASYCAYYRGEDRYVVSRIDAYGTCVESHLKAPLNDVIEQVLVADPLPY